MTLIDVQRLFRHWGKQPPTTTLLMAMATALGVKLPEPLTPADQYTTGEELKRLVDMTGGKIPGMGSI